MQRSKTLGHNMVIDHNYMANLSIGPRCYPGQCIGFLSTGDAMNQLIMGRHGPLTRYAKLRVAHAPGMPGTFSPPPLVSDPDMHHGTCLTHVPWCMPGSLTSGSLWNRWRRKRSRHSQRMRNPQFCVSGKRPMGYLFTYLVGDFAAHSLVLNGF